MSVRPILFVLALGLAALGLHTLARGEEEPAGDGPDVERKVGALEDRVAALEAEVGYLLSREADLTRYVLAGEARGKALVQMVARMRAQGFENRAIPAASRQTLLGGLEALGQDLLSDLPKVTREQSAMRTKNR